MDSMQLFLGGHCEFDAGGLHAADQFYGCVVVAGYCLREAYEQYNTSSIVHFYLPSAPVPAPAPAVVLVEAHACRTRSESGVVSSLSSPKSLSRLALVM